MSYPYERGNNFIHISRGKKKNTYHNTDSDGNSIDLQPKDKQHKEFKE